MLVKKKIVEVVDEVKDLVVLKAKHCRFFSFHYTRAKGNPYRTRYMSTDISGFCRKAIQSRELPDLETYLFASELQSMLLLVQ